MFLLGLPMILFAMAWAPFFPINKALWTSTYVLYTSGLAFVVLGFSIWLIDIKGYKTITQPAIIFGSNPLFIYAFSIVWVKILYTMSFPIGDGKSLNGYSWVYQKLFASWAGDMNGSLFFGLFHIIVFALIAWVLYRKKIFIKI